MRVCETDVSPIDPLCLQKGVAVEPTCTPTNVLLHPPCLCVSKTTQNLPHPPVQLTTGKFSCPPKEVWLKRIVHLKMKIMPSFTHSHDIPNLYDFLFFLKNTKDVLENVFVHIMKANGVQLRHFSNVFFVCFLHTNAYKSGT